MALETLPFLHSWSEAVHCRKIMTGRDQLTKQLHIWSPIGVLTQSCRLSPGDICRRRQQAYPANESSALPETSWPTKEIACHQTILKNSWSRVQILNNRIFLCLINLFSRARHLRLKKWTWYTVIVISFMGLQWTKIRSGWIRIRPDYRRRISESGIRQKINIRPSLIDSKE